MSVCKATMASLTTGPIRDSETGIRDCGCSVPRDSSTTGCSTTGCSATGIGDLQKFQWP